MDDVRVYLGRYQGQFRKLVIPQSKRAFFQLSNGRITETAPTEIAQAHQRYRPYQIVTVQAVERFIADEKRIAEEEQPKSRKTRRKKVVDGLLA